MDEVDTARKRTAEVEAGRLIHLAAFGRNGASFTSPTATIIDLPSTGGELSAFLDLSGKRWVLTVKKEVANG